MRLGISTEISHSSPEEWRKKIKRFGCTCVVFPTDYRADVNRIDEYVRIAREENWVIGEIGAWCSPLADDRKAREASLERCVEQLRLADYTKARCCVNVTGAAGERWDGAYAQNFSPEFYERIVKSIQYIIDTAKPVNTYYTIEPMPWMVPVGPEEYARLLRDVNRERFAVHMDIANWMCSYERYFAPERFIDEVAEKLGSRIKSCHLKDVKLKKEFTFQVQEVACGKGTLNLEYYVKKMLEIDPDMPVYIEHLGTEEEYLESMRYVAKRMTAAGFPV